jgi:hypothetical protein
MAFESAVMDNVKFDVAIEHQQKVDVWFQHGTLWCDDVSEDIAKTIASSIESCTGMEVIKSKLKATKTEPWDQWAFDITDVGVQLALNKQESLQ